MFGKTTFCVLSNARLNGVVVPFGTGGGGGGGGPGGGGGGGGDEETEEDTGVRFGAVSAFCSFTISSLPFEFLSCIFIPVIRGGYCPKYKVLILNESATVFGHRASRINFIYNLWSISIFILIKTKVTYYH